MADANDKYFLLLSVRMVIPTITAGRLLIIPSAPQDHTAPTKSGEEELNAC